MAIHNALAGVAVEDFDAAVQWYQHLIGQAPTRPMAEVAEWTLPGGGSLQVFSDAERAGHSSVTLTVDSIDQQLQALGTAGIPVQSQSSNDKVHLAIVHDPAGNQVVLAQAYQGAGLAT